MVRTNRDAPFIGTTKQCFERMINRYPGLAVHALLAEFCIPAERETPNTAIEKVQRWQRGAYFPGGEILLRLRCFLQLSGYEVAEYKRLRGEAQRLALFVGTGLIDPPDLASMLWPSKDAGSQPDTGALWRILVQGDGYVDRSKEEQVKELLSSHKKALNTHITSWKERIKEVTEQFASKPTQPKVAAAILPPGLSTSFQRLVAATTALGGALLDNSESRQAVIAATRGGQDLKELANLLRQFFPNGEDKT